MFLQQVVFSHIVQYGTDIEVLHLSLQLIYDTFSSCQFVKCVLYLIPLGIKNNLDRKSLIANFWLL